MNDNDDAKKKIFEAADATKEAMKEAAETAKASAKEFAQDTSDSAKEAIKTTRDAASHAFDTAQEGMRTVEKELSPAIDELTTRAQEFCCKGINFCAESTDRARRQFQHATECTTRYVVEQPCKSMLMAAAAGAAVAAAFLMGRRR